MALAIDNLIREIRKPVDSELSGSARKAELQSIALATTDAREMLRTLQELDETIKTLSAGDSMEDKADFAGGWAERMSKK